MAEEFNSERAFARQREILGWVQEARNILSNEVIDYYWDANTDTEAKNEENRDGMRRYIRDARDRLNRILDNDLD